MDLGAYENTRPFAYHLTARSNLDRIRAHRRLESALRLMRAAGVADATTRRRASLELAVGEDHVLVRDQQPLVEGNIEFDPGWDIARLVENLNSFVYFWPGTAEGPVRYGWNHYARYSGAREEVVVLRVPTARLLATNASPLFSSCNSGAPRMSGGKRCRRGGQTFVPAGAFALRPSRVVELVFEGRVELPAETACAGSPAGPWAALTG